MNDSTIDTVSLRICSRGAAIVVIRRMTQIPMNFGCMCCYRRSFHFTATTPNHTHDMIQRNLLRRSRALCSRSYHPSQSVISRYLPQPLRIPPLHTNISPRCYSTATETEGDARAEAAESEVNNEDPAKRELEAKSKEIIELKVRPPLIYHDTYAYAHPTSTLG